MKLLVSCLLLSVGSALAQDDPHTVAETALSALAARDGRALAAVAHPELVQRCRKARILEFEATRNLLSRETIASATDPEVMVLFCAAVKTMAPNPQSSVDRYVRTYFKGDLAVVVFENGWVRKSDGTIFHTMQKDVVLKKAGGEWRFLWSVEIQLHTDLSWDPLSEPDTSATGVTPRKT